MQGSQSEKALVSVEVTDDVASSSSNSTSARHSVAESSKEATIYRYDSHTPIHQTAPKEVKTDIEAQNTASRGHSAFFNFVRYTALNVYRRLFSSFNRDLTPEATRSGCCSALRPVNCSTDPSSIEINTRPQAPTCQNILTCPLFQLTSPLDWSPIRSRSTSSEGHRSRSSDVTRESE